MKKRQEVPQRVSVEPKQFLPYQGMRAPLMPEPEAWMKIMRVCERSWGLKVAGWGKRHP